MGSLENGARGARLVFRVLFFGIALLGTPSLAAPDGSGGKSFLPPDGAPLELRIALQGEVDDQAFGPVAATLRLQREPTTGKPTVAITVDADGMLGSLHWQAASAAELASRVPPFVFEVGERSLAVRIEDAGRYEFRLPTWVSGIGFGSQPDLPCYSQASSGFLELELGEDGARGRVELAGASWISQRPGVYRADISPLAGGAAAPPAAGRTALAELPEDQLTPELQLTQRGEKLLFAGDYAEAAARFEEALAIYRGRTQRPAGRFVQDGDWISQKTLLVKLTFCHFRIRDIGYKKLLEDLASTIEVDRRLEATGYLPTKPRVDTYSLTLENWRRRIEDDSGRVAALEDSQEFLEILLVYFLDQQRTDLALEVAELARARAHADLLAARGGRVVLPEPLSWRDIRKLVGGRPGPVVEYFATESFLAIWILTPAGKMTYATAPVSRTELDDTIDEVRTHIRNSSLASEGSRFRGLLRQLYGWLLAPIEQELPATPAEAITIVGHGQLLRLPFAALAFGEGPQDWVVHRHALLYLPSLAVLEQLDQRSRPAPDRQLLAFLAPEPLPEDMGAILGAESMASYFEELFPGTSRLLAGRAATETLFKQEAGRAGILFLATHAFAERDPPHPTAILLGKDSASDGYLEPQEIEKLDLAAELVVLTACHSGRGELKADGVQGLARSFFAAGARSVLATFWGISVFTPGQTVDFVKNRKAAAGQAEALRQVMAEAADAYRLQPTMWAGLALFG